MRFIAISITTLTLILALSIMPTTSIAQNYSDIAPDDLQQRATALSEAANRASLSSGIADPGAIACDGFVCTCQGAFDCAWLAYFCSVAGGIRGFDGECYTPARDPETNRAVLDLQLALSPGIVVGAQCDGIFCSCSGGAGSDDCRKLNATCLDDVSCVGDSCGCIGGSVDE